MSNNTNLPVVAGGLGAAQSVADLAAQKTIIVTGLVGTIKIEASADGTNFVGIFTFTAGAGSKQQTLTVAARSMRVNATAGDASSVEVIAEESLARNGVVPVPPDNGPGAALDITTFGPITTVYVSNHTGQALQNDGVVNIEISADGVNWAQAFKSFDRASFDTQVISARFIRAVGSAATADIAVASEESPSQSITSPALAFIFRPGGVQGGNVYTTWPDLMTALGSVEGRKLIEVDSSIAPAFTTAGTFNLRDTILGGFPVPPGAAFPRHILTVIEGTVLTNWRYVENVAIKFTCTATRPVQDLTSGENFMPGLFGGFPQLINAGTVEAFDAPGGVNFRCMNTIFGVGGGTLGTNTFPLIRQTGAGTIQLTGSGAPMVFGENVGTGFAGGTFLFNAGGYGTQFAQVQTTITGPGGLISNLPVGHDQRRVLPEAPTAAAVANQTANTMGTVVRANGTGAGFTETLQKIDTGFAFQGVPMRPVGANIGLAEVSGGSALILAPAAGDTIQGKADVIPLPPSTFMDVMPDGALNWIPVATTGGMPASFAWIGEITPAVLAAVATQNYNPTDLGLATALRITSDGGGSALGGIVGGTKGRVLVIHNIGGGVLTINSADGGSTAANQFLLTANIVIPINGCATFRYDSTSLRWRCIGAAL